MEKPHDRADQTPADAGRRRSVRSFVLRGGRLTDAQKRALDELWPVFGLPGGEQPLDFKAVFGNARPVILEIGFGNGEATWRMAQARPEENFVGVEVHRPGVGHLLLQLEAHGISNVRIANQDAVEFLQRRVPAASLQGVRIYFPDPWPKKRHHKRRIVQGDFVALLASRLRDGAVLHVATDWAPYAEHILAVLERAPDLRNLSSDAGYCQRPEWRPATRYERRGQRLGHRVFDLLFERRRRRDSG
ncbi:MAG: tRNA (guanosine(46)-N7)-methyltransferase TrmB [Xanthomonadales bacterium]|nr:tRNA (guanosine(46)-N7)-methyltransferase TrmB [Xanthomonadales bacterium]